MSEEPTREELLEILSDLVHRQWAHWTRYMLDNYTPENVERWRRQLTTGYKDLSEPERIVIESRLALSCFILKNGKGKRGRRTNNMFANIQDIVTEEMFLTALLAISVCVALWRIKKNTRP